MGDVQPHKASERTGLCASEQENRVEKIKAPIRGSLCAFEHPRRHGDAELTRLADRQHRCLHRRQLLAGGLGRAAIAGRLQRGLLTSVYRDVYLWRADTADAMSLAMATALHLRGDAILSGPFAAWVWKLADEQPSVITATAVRFARARTGTTIHRVASVDRADIRWRRGLPCTAPARTLIDYAATADPLEAESALAKVRRSGLASDRQVQEALDRLPRNHPGVPIVRHLLSLAPGELSLTKSRYERKLRMMIAAAGLPAPTSNHGVEGVESDLVWVDRKLIIEFDGWETHKSKVHADKARDARLIAAGWRVLRLTADRVDREPLLVIAQIARALFAGE
jgi:very-short-patch-repair endonuclease